jgi:hypothetical protein
MDFANALETTRTDLVRFGCAPGGYIFVCNDCEKSGIGAKRSIRCEVCAVLAKNEDETIDQNHWQKIIDRATD